MTNRFVAADICGGDFMRRFILVWGLLCAVAFPFYAQNRTPQDSLRLNRQQGEGGEMKLNPEALRELEMNSSWGIPKAVRDKPWMDVDGSFPVRPKVPEKRMVLTLRPYTANTKYDWDPVYQKKIKVDKDTWRGDKFYALKTPTGGWQGTGSGGIGGLDLMAPFTREFWNFKGRKRRARTLEVLKAYGDSTTVLIQQPVSLICK